MLRRSLVLAALLSLLAAAGASAQPRATPAVLAPVFVVTGHGWGHGVGMSQYGAYGYAQHGWTYRQILGHYYTGTTIGPAPLSRVRVLLADGQASATVSSTAPFKVKDATGTVHTLPALSVAFGPGMKLLVDDATEPQALPGPLVFQPGAAPLTYKRAYRGQIQVDLNTGGKLRLINLVGLEQYLYGVVPAEMPAAWSPEALKAQAVVARSYALAVRKTGGAFDLYADTRSQMYLGVAKEQPTSNAAVDATAGQVVLYNGLVATTYFFSTSGGRTANVADVWGTTPIPYLVSVDDPYDTISPHHSWGPVVFTGDKLAKAFKVLGRVLDATPTLNASGRVQLLTLTGIAGTAEVPATLVRTALGLRSTWFDVGVLGLGKPATTLPVTYGSTVQLSGVARGLSGVSLEQRPPAASWQPVSPVTPAADGTLTVAAKPVVTTDYRLTAPGIAAGSVRVSVAPRIRFTGTQPGAVQGLVRPLLPGATVQIQRQDGTAWTTLGTATVDDNGDFAAQLQLASGTYRARVAPGKGFAAGTTPPLSVIGP
jgi:stage II sporulation protein D